MNQEITENAVVRFYQWCLLDAEAEHAAGFPFVSLFRGFGARVFLYAADRLPRDEQKKLLLALVRRRHERALRLRGELVPVEDQTWLSYYMKDRILPPLTDRPIRQGETKEKMLSAKELVTRLMESDELPISAAGIKRECGTIFFDWQQNGLTVQTSLDVGGRSRGVSFQHRLMMSSKAPLISGENPLGWMGVGTAQWIHVRSRDADMIADAVAQSAKRFRRAVDFITGEIKVDGSL